MGVFEEDVVARRVNQIDFSFLPFKRSEGGGDAYFAVDFFFVKIGYRSAVIGQGQTLRRTGRIEKGTGQRRLSRMPVPNQSHVPDIGTFMDFHRAASQPGAFRSSCDRKFI